MNDNEHGGETVNDTTDIEHEGVDCYNSEEDCTGEAV
jgi:hypothetical protein